MKKIFTLFAAAVFMLAVSSCSKLKFFDYTPDSISFTYDTSQAGTHYKTASQKYDIAATLKSFGISSSNVDGLNLKSLKLNITTSGVTFADCSDIEMKIYSAGLDTVRVGWANNISTSAGSSLNLEVDEAVNILKYANTGEVFFKLKLVTRRNLPSVTIKAERAEVFPAKVSSLGI